MKYLSSRTEYLKSAKYKVVNEAVVSGAGPFANDIAWGDSLLGRMLHSFARKAQIGIDLVRIDSVIKRLKTQFDYLVDTAKLNGAEIDEATNKEIDMLSISILIGKLIKAIKEPEAEGKNHLDEIIRVTTETIYAITEVVLYSDESEGDRQEVLEKLTEFLAELKEMEETDDEETDDEETDGEETDGEKIPYQLYMANIKSISSILESFKKIKSVRSLPAPKEVEEPEQVHFEWGVKGEDLYQKKLAELLKSQKALGKGANLKPGEHTRKKFKQEVAYKIWSEKGNSGTMEDFKKSKEGESFLKSVAKAETWNKVPDTELYAESMNDSFRKFSLNEGTDDKKQDNIPILNATKALFNFMNEDPNNLVELQGLISSYDKMSDDNKNKLSAGNAEMMQKYASVKNLYDHIKKTSVSENLDSLLSGSEALGNHIKNLYSVSKSGDLTEIDEWGKDIDGALKNSIKSFNETMSAILEQEPEVTENEKPEDKVEKNEGKLLRYKSFRKIFEAEGEDVVDDTTKDKPSGDVSKEDQSIEKENRYDLSIPWNKFFSEEYLRKWSVTEQDAKNLEQRLVKMEKEGTTYKINGIDPILEIVKIFNRAYKLHTSQTIPTGRSGGKVSNKKFREYEYIGSGSPEVNTESSGFKVGMGPYRNIRIFTKWEDAVLDIIKDSKYTVLFDESTIIQVGKADDRVNVSPTSISDKGKKSGRVEGGGKVLLKFMNDMLDGDTLYRSSGGKGGGAQHKFISKYFKVDVDSNKLDYTGGKEVEGNAEVADETKGNIIAEFKKSKEVNDKPGCIFNLNNSYFMIVIAGDSDFTYLKYSKTFGYISKYIKGENVKGMKGDLSSSLNDNDSTIHYARISNKLFDAKGGLLKEGINLKLKSINLTTLKERSSELKTEEVDLGKIEDLYTFYVKEGEGSGEQYLLPTSATQNAYGDISVDKAKGYLEK
jgi:hypothetical protein